MFGRHLLQSLEDGREGKEAAAHESLELVLGVHGVPDVVLVVQLAEHHIQPALLHQVHDLQGQVVRVVQQFHRPGLEQHRFEVLEGLRHPHHYQVRAHLEQRVGYKLVVLADRDEVVGEVLPFVLEGDHGAFGEHLRDAALQGPLGLAALALLAAEPVLHLVGRFELLDHDQLVAQLDELVRVLLQTLFREAHVHLVAHPLEVQVAVADRCVLVEHLVELAQLEQNHLVEVLALYAPVLLHCLRHAFYRLARHVQTCWVVLRVIRSPPSSVSAPLGKSPLRRHVAELLLGLLVA